MSITYDFRIISDTKFPGISLVMAQNESAFNYLIEEEEFNCLSDGSVPLADYRVGDFINDAELAQMSTDYV